MSIRNLSSNPEVLRERINELEAQLYRRRVPDHVWSALADKLAALQPQGRTVYGLRDCLQTLLELVRTDTKEETP